MVIRTKVEPISDWIEITVRETLSPEAKRKAVANFAKERLSEAQTQNERILGRVPPHETYVDGRKGAQLESVNPSRGTIVFEFEFITDVLRWIAETLVARSPEISGDYKRGHTLFADGKEIDVGGLIPQAEEYSFTNLVPYSRKIEIGKTTKGRDFVIQVPNRIYERTAQDGRRRFGNIVKLEFTYRGLIGMSSGNGTLINPLKDPTRGGVRGRDKKGRFSSQGGPKAYNVSSVRFPCINVTLR